MSMRHRVALVLDKLDPNMSWAYEIYGTSKHAYFVFDDKRSADIVSQMLRLLIKRKPLIHNGRKPR